MSSISLKALKQQFSNMADVGNFETPENVPRRLLLLEKNFENFGQSDTKSAYFSSKYKRYLDGFSRCLEFLQAPSC